MCTVRWRAVEADGAAAAGGEADGYGPPIEISAFELAVDPVRQSSPRPSSGPSCCLK